jgi:hypothetical protein
MIKNRFDLNRERKIFCPCEIQIYLDNAQYKYINQHSDIDCHKWNDFTNYSQMSIKEII